MRKLGFVTLTLFAFSIIITGCGSKKEAPQVQSIEESKVSKKQQILMDAVAERMSKMEALQKKVMSGKISEDEAGRLVKQYAREFAIKTNFNPAIELPDWAIRLGLVEPEGMKLDSAVSRRTQAENLDEGFNSITLVYTGEYDQAMAEAKRIAEKAGIPISKEYLKAKERMEKARMEAFRMGRLDGFEGIKGIAYMNYDLDDQGRNFDIKYLISISVDSDGELSLNAADHEQLATGMERQNQMY